jgi:hypothetical protein
MSGLGASAFATSRGNLIHRLQRGRNHIENIVTDHGCTNLTTHAYTPADCRAASRYWNAP